ncbi:MAG: carboxypeptidase-like regulatory domain-containing protein [Balneola sp.]|nr:MAG: carboxypeptidase-like regulatory domain-containing protein [Balneola sp.]
MCRFDNKNNTLFISFFFLIFSIGFYNLCNSQVGITSTIVSDSTGLPLPYVNIGVLGTRIGTVSSIDGSFLLVSDKIEISDSVKFSYVGYENIVLVVDQVKELNEIRMVPVKFSFTEITVNSNRLGKEKIFGNDSKRKGGTVLSNWRSGDEIATKISFEKPTYITSANFKISQIVGDSMFFRINIYDFQDGKVGENLIRDNVYLKEKQKTGVVTKDISFLNLILNGDVLLSLERIRIDGEVENRNLLFRYKISNPGNFFARDLNYSSNINDEFRLVAKTELQFFFRGIEL